jgi:hypothetical protein
MSFPQSGKSSSLTLDPKYFTLAKCWDDRRLSMVIIKKKLRIVKKQEQLPRYQCKQARKFWLLYITTAEHHYHLDDVLQQSLVPAF